MDKLDKNDFRINRENFTAEKILTEENFEHSVEKDFVLPDYYPDIFRVLKCNVTPVIISQGINGGKFSYEGTAQIRVIYVSENSKAINCIEAKAVFSKSAELSGECVNPAVTIVPECEYVNCRVVNQRRLDIRGAISCYVKVTGEENSAVVTDAFGKGIQLKKIMCSLPTKRITSAKRITLVEDLELADTKPPFRSVIKCDCRISDKSEKIIAGKLVTKGNAEINVLYTCAENSGEQNAEKMKFTVPFSQIIDMEGIDESFCENVEISVSDLEIVSKGDSGKNLECELTLFVNCTAIKYTDTEIVADAYSTEYECETQTSTKSITGKYLELEKDFSAECTADCCENPIKQIYDCTGQIKSLFCKRGEDKKSFELSGNIAFGILGKDENDTPFFFENECAFEEKMPLPDDIELTAEDTKDTEFLPKAVMRNCSFRISGNKEVEIKFDFGIFGQLKTNSSRNFIENISILTDKPKEIPKGYALKLCRINGKEDIWDIAKKYSTSVKAILEENNLDNDNQGAEGMLLIPLMK